MTDSAFVTYTDVNGTHRVPKATYDAMLGLADPFVTAVPSSDEDPLPHIPDAAPTNLLADLTRIVVSTTHDANSMPGTEIL